MPILPLSTLDKEYALTADVGVMTSLGDIESHEDVSKRIE